MANSIEIIVDSIESDLSTFTLVDDTTYSSPARSTLGVFGTLQKIAADSTVEETLTLTTDDSDPETNSEFTASYGEDGWYKFSYVAVPDYSGGETYEIYDLVFDAATDKVWRSKQNSNVGQALAAGAYWEEITGNDIGLIAQNEGEDNESANIDSAVYEFIMTGYSERAYATKIAEASEQYLTSTFIPDDVLDTYSILSLLVNSAYVHSDRSQYSQGERVVDRLSSIIEQLD